MLLWLGLAIPPADAEATPEDLRIIVRVLGFLEHPPTGDAELGIVYPALSKAGLAEAERIVAAFGEGLRAGSLTLRARPVPLEAVASAAVVAFLLTDAALPQAGELAAALAGRGLPSITTSPDPVENGTAVIAVRSTRRVGILVSRTAAEKAGVRFTAAFRMMIQER